MEKAEHIEIKHSWGTVRYLVQDGCIQSVQPATAHFGSMYWAAMVPPFTPKNVLMLGVGYGTVAELIKRVHPTTRITGVDLEDHQASGVDTFIAKDAQAFVAQAAREKKGWDYVVVDIFEGFTIPEWVTSQRFLKQLKAITRVAMTMNVIDDNRLHDVTDSLAWTIEDHRTMGGNSVGLFIPGNNSKPAGFFYAVKK